MSANCVVVVGSSGGIGSAVVDVFLEQGLDVFGLDLNPPPDSKYGLVNDPQSQKVVPGQGRFFFVKVDLREADSVAEAAQNITSARSHMGVNVLVHCAGVSIGGPLEFIPMTQIREQFEVNLFSALDLTNQMLPLLRQQSGSKVMVIGSPSGSVPMAMMGPYASTKAATRALICSLRLELTSEDDPQIVLLESGMIKTNMWSDGASQAEEIKGRLGQSELAGRYESTIDVALRFLDRGFSVAAAPSGIAKKVSSLASKSRLRRRYTYGNDARFVAAIARLMPDVALDAVCRQMLKPTTSRAGKK